MPRLSNTSTFGQRNYPSESLSPQKVFAIAYEGNVTEKSYFNGIKNQKDRSFPELLDELGSNVGDLMAKILEI